MHRATFDWGKDLCSSRRHEGARVSYGKSGESHFSRAGSKRGRLSAADARAQSAGLRWAPRTCCLSGQHFAYRCSIPTNAAVPRLPRESPLLWAWSREPLHETVCNTLLLERVRRAGLLDVAASARVLEDHVSAHKNRGRTLWTLVSLQRWAKNGLPHAPAMPHTHACGTTAHAESICPASRR